MSTNLKPHTLVCGKQEGFLDFNNKYLLDIGDMNFRKIYIF